MPALTLKNIPEELLQRLRDSAHRNRRSITSEVLARLDAALPPPPEDPDVTIARLAKLRKKWKLKPLTEADMEQIQADKILGAAMIVADTNVIAYMIAGVPAATTARRHDPEWASPMLWRSEYRNVLALRIRREHLSVGAALELFHAAEQLVINREHQADAARVLRLVAGSRCSAYDCEFVAVAQALGVPLVTADRRLAAEFPETAIALDVFAA